LGDSATALCEAYFRGEQGIQAMQDPSFNDLPARLGAPCPCPIDRILQPFQSRRIDRTSQLGLLAAAEAWSDQHTAHFQPDRIGVVFSSGIGGVNQLIAQLQVLNERGPSKVSPHTVSMIMPNAVAAQVGLQVGATGWLEAPVSACAGGTEAIQRGVMLLRAGLVDVVIAGGAEAILHRFGVAAFAAMQALSTRNSAPASASRPFDRERDGFVIGEGAGALVLERLDEAEARGANIRGLVLGAGSSADAHDIVAPRPDGRQAQAAMRRALDDAGVQPHDLQLVKAHATGTQRGDRAEAQALADLWSGEPPPSAAGPTWLIAPKAVLGHLISASGPVECILTLEALRRGEVPAQANCEQPEALLPLSIPLQTQALAPGYQGKARALVNSFGFGGKNVSLVLQGWR
jgi:3-oxoacyl-[acyl-carrier-protein] synthase II